jgi:hypothetical protein
MEPVNYVAFVGILNACANVVRCGMFPMKVMVLYFISYVQDKCKIFVTCTWLFVLVALLGFSNLK